MFIDRLRIIMVSTSCFLVLFLLQVSHSGAADQIVFLALFDNDTAFQVWSISSDGTKLKRLTNLQEQITNLYQLNDPNHVAYLSESEIYLLDLCSGKSRLLVARPQTNHKDKFEMPCISFSPDSYGVTISERVAEKFVLNYFPFIDFTKSDILFTEATSAIMSIGWNRNDTTTIYFLYSDIIYKTNIRSKSLKKLTYPHNDIISFSISDNEALAAINFFDKQSNKSQIAVYNDVKLIDTITSKYSVVDPHMSRDGNTLLYVDDYGLEKNRLMLYSIPSKQTTVILEGKGAIASPILATGVGPTLSSIH